MERLNQAGIPDKDILILCATGTHRQQTEEEHISLVGEDLYRRIQFRDHNCDDKEHLTYMGTTSRASLQVTLYQDAAASRSTHTIPAKITRFTFPFFTAQPLFQVIYLSLNKINISLEWCAVKRKETNISLFKVPS